MTEDQRMSEATIATDDTGILAERTAASRSETTRNWRRTARLTGTVLTFACLVGWFFLFRPPALGGTASFIGVSGISMTGTFSNGSLAVVEKKSSYQVGNIVAYRIPAGEPGAGENIIHRIVGGNGTSGFVTKGDHNSYTDHFWHPKTADVIGRVWFVIPGGATWLAKLRQPLTLAVLVGLISFALIAWPSKRKNAADSEASEDFGMSDEESVSQPVPANDQAADADIDGDLVGVGMPDPESGAHSR